jgi:hypothetical protein
LRQNQVAEIGIRFWKPSPELVLSSGDMNGVGVNGVDFVNDFSIADKSFKEFRASIGRSHKFRVSHVRFEYDAEAVVEKTIVFQGRRLTVGAPASTNINWNLWTLGYEWDVVSNRGGFLGVVADLKYNTLEASIESPALTSAAFTDVTAPIPTVGVIGRGYLGSAGSITAEFTGLRLTRDTWEGKFYDFDIYGTVHLGRQLGVSAGYRSIDVHYLVDDDIGDLKMKGPYVGGTLRF